LPLQGGADIGADGVLGFGARQQQMAAAKAEKRARLEADLKQQIAERQARRVGTTMLLCAEWPDKNGHLLQLPGPCLCCLWRLPGIFVL
jgi:hypothetical protein